MELYYWQVPTYLLMRRNFLIPVARWGECARECEYERAQCYWIFVRMLERLHICALWRSIQLHFRKSFWEGLSEDFSVQLHFCSTKISVGLSMNNSIDHFWQSYWDWAEYEMEQLGHSMTKLRRIRGRIFGSAIELTSWESVGIQKISQHQRLVLLSCVGLLCFVTCWNRGEQQHQHWCCRSHGSTTSSSTPRRHQTRQQRRRRARKSTRRQCRWTFSHLRGTVRGWVKEWGLGCVNPFSWLPLAMGEFTQPGDHSFVQPVMSGKRALLFSLSFLIFDNGGMDRLTTEDIPNRPALSSFCS